MLLCSIESTIAKSLFLMVTDFLKCDRLAGFTHSKERIYRGNHQAVPSWIGTTPSPACF